MSQKTKRMILWIAAIVGIALFALVILLPRLQSIAARRMGGQMQVSVYDGDNNAPLENAVIVVPEAKIEAVTDNKGQTAILTLPLLKDARFDKTLPKTWGEVTVIVYRDGYTPYILTDAQVFENQLRDGPVVYLFRSQGNDTPYAIVEGPERQWVADMIDKYRPAMPGQPSPTPTPTP